jgi:hypothetical protein
MGPRCAVSRAARVDAQHLRNGLCHELRRRAACILFRIKYFTRRNSPREWLIRHSVRLSIFSLSRMVLLGAQRVLPVIRIWLTKPNRVRHREVFRISFAGNARYATCALIWAHTYWPELDLQLKSNYTIALSLSTATFYVALSFSLPLLCGNRQSIVPAYKPHLEYRSLATRSVSYPEHEV